MMNSVRTFCLPILTLLFLSAAGCTHPYVRTIDAYRAAKKQGDYETARTCLADNPRVWFGKREGEGSPLRPAGGPYAEWDKEMNAKSERIGMKVRDHTVSYDFLETNDYYRLVDRQPAKIRVTYYLDDDGKIEGYLVQRLTPPNRRPPDRCCEFERWVEEKYPGMLENEETKIPANPRRWREVLVEWRNDVGLPPVE